MKRMRRNSMLSGAVILFVSIAMLVTVTLLVFVFVNDASGGNKTVVSLVMLAVIVAVAFLCTLIDYFRRKYTIDRPVKKILDATDRIAAGDFAVRLDIEHTLPCYDEFDYIMENLNKMATELSRTEMLHNDFISNVSHELKTPLSVIQSYASSLQNPALDEETRINYAAELVKAAKRLTALVTNILKLNRLENQEIKSESVPIDLGEMLAQAVIGFEDAIEKKGLVLDCDAIGEGVRVISSPSYLEIVWNNLLSNAVKFTDEGGTVAVSVTRENDRAVVVISDTGCGISAETGKHIFEKFYQGDTSHAQEGNGLGLAMVKRVIDIIGGTIGVKSELGKGTAFTISLKATDGTEESNERER